MRAAVRWQAKLRTTLTGFDRGLDRLRLAAIATASMVLNAYGRVDILANNAGSQVAADAEQLAVDGFGAGHTSDCLLAW